MTACKGEPNTALEDMLTDVSPFDQVLPPSQGGTPLIVSSLGDAFAPLLDDALAQPEEARPYLRYVLASRELAALDHEKERSALLRLVNSTSLSPQITAPVALPDLRAYRLDLRDYLWERQVVVGTETFADAWEAIVARSGLALPALPDEQLATLTGTTTAVLPARAFLAAASNGLVYYALTSAPGFETELQTRLGARFPEPPMDKEHNAGLGDQARHDYQGARRLLMPDGSAYWQGLPDTPRGNSLFSSPFNFNSWETDAIYPLPNGFPAFFLDTPYNKRVGGPAPLTRLPGREVNTSDELVADCIACHSSGPLPVEDTFDDYAREDAAYSSVDYEEILSRWPSQEELDAIVAADSAVYERTIQRAGLSLESAGALQAITRGYAGGLDLRDMAAALHASETQVRAVLPMGTTTLDAASFHAQFRLLLCQIHPDATAVEDYCLPSP
jgi:hypothetical protein